MTYYSQFKWLENADVAWWKHIFTIQVTCICGQQQMGSQKVRIFLFSELILTPNALKHLVKVVCVTHASMLTKYFVGNILTFLKR